MITHNKPLSCDYSFHSITGQLIWKYQLLLWVFGKDYVQKYFLPDFQTHPYERKTIPLRQNVCQSRPTAMQDALCMILTQNCKLSLSKKSGRLPCCVTSVLCDCARESLPLLVKLRVSLNVKRGCSCLATGSVSGGSRLRVSSEALLQAVCHHHL